MEINTADRKKVYLALPTYSNSMRRDFVLSLMQILWLNPIPDVEFVLGTIGGDGVARARNNLAQNFILSTDCEIMLPIDVDVIFTRQHVADIIEACSKKRPIVGASYAAKQMWHRWIRNDIPGEVPDEDGLLKVSEIGTGLKAYHRCYFEEVMGAFPEIQYFCDGGQGQLVKWDFFSMGVVDGRYLSEDYYTDYRAKKIGMPVYCHTKVEIQHEGFMLYPFTANFPVFDGMSVSDIIAMAKKMGSDSFRDPDGPREIPIVRTHA